MWEPMEDFCIRFVDKSGEIRDEGKLDEMVKHINEIVNKYDFGIKMYGGLECFSNALEAEKKLIRKTDRMIRELDRLKRQEEKHIISKEEEEKLYKLFYKKYLYNKEFSITSGKFVGKMFLKDNKKYEEIRLRALAEANSHKIKVKE